MGKESRFRIKKTKVGQESSRINPSSIDDTEKVSFNFKRLCEKREKFCYTTKEANYFLKLLERLRDVSRMKKLELVQSFNNKTLRCHRIDFTSDSTSETSFGLGEDIDADAWQFSLSQNEHGRIHGYFVGNIFYVVWLDPNHELFSGQD